MSDVLVNILVTEMLVISAEDVETWTGDPENFAIRQDSLTKEEHIRPCAEHLVLSLLERHKELLISLIQNMLPQIENEPLSGSSAEHAILTGQTEHGQYMVSEGAVRRDALYLVIGDAAYTLHDSIPFPQWFMESLAVLLQPDSQMQAEMGFGAVLLQRRILWLVGCFVQDLTDELRVYLYSSIVALLDSSDMVVRVSAVTTLKLLVEDWDFTDKEFIKVFPMAIQALYAVVADAQEFETRLQALALVGSCVERLSEKSAPFIPAVVDPLPLIWEAAQEQNLLRGAVLTILRHSLTAGE